MIYRFSLGALYLIVKSMAAVRPWLAAAARPAAVHVNKDIINGAKHLWRRNRGSMMALELMLAAPEKEIDVI